MSLLQSISIRNFRALRSVDFAAKEINVVFGPNGAGKTTFLDALNFLRECLSRGPGEAASERHHGIGLLTDGLEEGDNRILIGFDTPSASYEVSFGYSSGRIEPFVGERLTSKLRQGLTLVDRKSGSDQAAMYHEQLQQVMTVKLADPERLALSNFMLFSQPDAEAEEVSNVLRSLHFYSSRAVNLYQLRRLGSESSVHTYPFDRWQNLWSALRNLQGRRAADDRYDTIVRHMREAFPVSFKDLLIEPLGSERVGGSVIEVGHANPILASGVSDGHLQLLGLLTALFGDTKYRSNIILFDEPETSLHPHAIAVFARAVIEASQSWDRQIFIATHSPVLLSQFKPDEIVLASLAETGSPSLRRLSEIDEVRVLLADYSVGSLYMAEAVGAQSSSSSSEDDQGIAQ